MKKCNVLDNIKLMYSYLSDDDIELLYNEALYDYLSLAFPYDKSLTEIPENYERDYMWVQKRIIDIIERRGVSNLVSYKENGMSYEFGNPGINPNLVTEIISRAGNVN